MASFIGGVLNSIGAGDGSNGTPASRPPPARINGSAVSIAGTKRKADGDTGASGGKISKLTETSNTRVVKTLPQRSVLSATAATPQKSSKPPTPGSAPQLGSRPKPAVTATGPRSSISGAKTGPLMSRSVAASCTTTRHLNNGDRKQQTSSKASTPATPAASAAKPAQLSAKRGGFKAMMARAQQAQSSQPVGGIKHQPAMSVKQRLLQAKKEAAEKKAAEKNKSIGKGKEKPGIAGKAGLGHDMQEKGTSIPGERYKGTAQPKVVSGYQGTARPSNKPQPAYRGTSKASAGLTKQPSTKAASRYQRDEYLGTDEEDEDGYGYADDDQYTEASDDYSDMDVGAETIFEEEERAEKEAKRDDKKEQAELDKRAQEKAARKKTFGR